MLPLSFTNAGEEVMVVKIGGNSDVKQHLMDLGFVPGAVIQIISQHKGDVIVNLKDSHLAITEQMAKKIMVQN
ncbi:MAG: ferrous iron transport protein A [Lachnospiraceae bacterium]|nr:ferrous iron transport protein A [Lachnospiraceae bacterium]